MPRKAIDYSKCVIYKLCCLDPNITDEYIGHTTSFVDRKKNHKKNCNNKNGKYYNLKVYQFIRENGGWENWKMIQIEEYSCNNSREAELREQYWITYLNATLNMIKSFINENEKLEYKKKYYENNKTEINYKKREYMKYYTENNKDKIKEYHKEYEKKNRDYINAKRREQRRLKKEQENQSQ